MDRVPTADLRDPDIRQPLQEWLLAQHAGDPEAALIHEFKMPRPSARADIALVNGRMEAYEIKSDVDSLSRLQRQITAFSRIFDRVSVVTTDRHLKTVKCITPSWCGVIVLRETNGEVCFVRSRRGRAISKPDLTSLLYTLERKELLMILSSQDATDKVTKQTKEELIRLVAAFGPRIRDVVRDVLRKRKNAIQA